MITKTVETVKAEGNYLTETQKVINLVDDDDDDIIIILTTRQNVGHQIIQYEAQV